MPRIILILAIVLVVYFAMRWIMRSNPTDVSRVIRKGATALIIGALVFLAATGRLHWLFALVASIFAFLPRLLPLLRYVPLLGGLIAYFKRKRAAAAPSGGQQSRVETRFLRMTLEHDTGSMNGEILEGQFKGQQLGNLSLDQLLILYKEYRTQDEQSAALLQTYLDRVHGEKWRDTIGEATSSVATGKMNRNEAYEILGLKSDAGEQEVIDAHRRLMQKLHPDRGGSNYLAAKINQAKDLLLGK